MKNAKSIQQTARVAGLLYLLVTVFASISGYVKSTLVIAGDPGITAQNLVASAMLSRLGFLSDLLHQTIHIFLVLLLFRILKSVNPKQALSMAVLGLIGVPVAILNMLNHFAAIHLLSGAAYLEAFSTEQLHGLMAFFLDLLDHGFYLIYIPWGLWLLPMGLLVYRSGFIPRFVGILLIIACFGYLLDFLSLFLFPGFPEIRFYTFLGEPLLALWLLIKGVKRFDGGSEQLN